MQKQSPATSRSPSPGANLLVAYFLGFLGVLSFAGSLPFTRLGLADFSPGFLTFLRAAIALLLAAASLVAFKKPFRHEQDFRIFVAGLFLIFTFPGFMALAMQTVPASHGGVILGFLPLATAILARLFTDEKPSAKFWILSITGCLVVSIFTFVSADEHGISGISAGDAWLILAGLTAAAGYVIFGALSRTTPGWEITARALLLNAPLILAGLWWFYEPGFLAPSGPGVLAALYLGCFSMYLGFCAWNVALARGGIARMGQVQLLQTFLTIAIAAVLLGEELDALTVVAAIAITALIAASRKS